MNIIPSFPFTLQNNTPNDATQVMANFTQIQTDVNTKVAHNGGNSDITSLTGLTTALGVSYGGTGSTTAAAARTALGVAASGANTDITSLASPALAGATATTQAQGNNTTKVATTAYADRAGTLPVGSLYFNASVATNPATLLGYGTWTAFGQGRVILGVGTGTDTNAISLVVTNGATSGEYVHTLTSAELPAHTHPLNYKTGLSGSEGDGPVGSQGSGTSSNFWPGSSPTGTYTTTIANNTGGGASHNVTQPWIGVYVWLRTA